MSIAFMAGEEIKCIFPQGQKWLTEGKIYRVDVPNVCLSESRQPAVKVIDDSGESSWYYAWRFTYATVPFLKEGDVVMMKGELYTVAEDEHMLVDTRMVKLGDMSYSVDYYQICLIDKNMKIKEGDLLISTKTHRAITEGSIYCALSDSYMSELSGERVYIQDDTGARAPYSIHLFTLNNDNARVTVYLDTLLREVDEVLYSVNNLKKKITRLRETLL